MQKYVITFVFNTNLGPKSIKVKDESDSLEEVSKRAMEAGLEAGAAFAYISLIVEDPDQIALTQ